MTRTLRPAMAIDRALAGVAVRQVDRPALVYLDARDLTGFIDGTENPSPEEAPGLAPIAEGEGRGGSFAPAQQWNHDLERFDALAVAEPAKAIGRTKAGSVQPSRDAVPATAHVSRTDAACRGTPVKLRRRSVPFADLGEHGLSSVSFVAEIDGLEFLLKRMFGATDDGLSDRLTEHSTPVTGSCFFVPSRQDVEATTGI